jgi:hypothetical protein
MVGVWNINEPYEARSRDMLGMQGAVSRCGCVVLLSRVLTLDDHDASDDIRSTHQTRPTL